MNRKLLFVVALFLCGGLAAKTSTLTFTAKCNGSGTADDGAVWTITSDASESTYSSTKGIKYGSTSETVSYISLNTSNIPGEITQVKVNACSDGSIGSAKTYVSVGGIDYLCNGYAEQAIGKDPQDYIFTGSASGNIIVGIVQTMTKKSLYCKSIEVTYTDDLVVHDDEEIRISSVRTVGDLTIEDGGKLILDDKKLTVKGDFILHTTMGSGASGQLVGATDSNFEVQGNAYIDITLGDGGNPAKWHAFTVPFPVDATNGIFDTDLNMLTNGTHFAIMAYRGDLRADGGYGWQKFNGVMTPGTFYLMTTDGLRTTFRMKKADGDLIAAASKDYLYYTGSSGSDDFGWNGLGNPTFQYVKVAYPVQVLNPDNYVFTTKLANACNFVVGTPFFYQASANGSMAMLSANAEAFYAPARVQNEERMTISLAFGNADYTDYLYLSADAEANESYEIGKDLVKMTMTDQPAVPQIFGVAYGTELCMVNMPLTNGQAACELLLYAPQTGSYTLATPETNDGYLYLTSNGTIVTPITSEAAAVSLQKGYNEGYGIVWSDKPLLAPTDVERVGDDVKATKILRDNRLLIRRGETIYDLNGNVITNHSAL